MKRRTGRPPLDPDDPSVRLTLTIQATRYDAVYRRAVAARQSVPEYLREAIARDLKNQKSPRRAPSR